MAENRKIVVLTEGFSNPVTAKTGASVIRYCEPEVLAVLDAENAGKRAAELLGAGADIPVVATLSEVPDAKTLLIGTAPTGGRLPDRWRAAIGEALKSGLNVVSGLHDFIGDDPEFTAIAERAERRSQTFGVTPRRRLNRSATRERHVANSHGRPRLLDRKDGRHH